MRGLQLPQSYPYLPSPFTCPSPLSLFHNNPFRPNMGILFLCTHSLFQNYCERKKKKKKLKRGTGSGFQVPIQGSFHFPSTICFTYYGVSSTSPPPMQSHNPHILCKSKTIELFCNCINSSINLGLSTSLNHSNIVGIFFNFQYFGINTFAAAFSKN